MLDSILSLWTRTNQALLPDSARPMLESAIELYAEEVEANPAFQDLLGPLYMEMAAQMPQKELGQFFTPWVVASANAAIVHHDQSVPSSSSGPLFRIGEPSSGSGVMLLAYLNHLLSEQGKPALRSLSIHAWDLDPLCARMTAVQIVSNLNLRDVTLGELFVVHGNSLTKEIHEVIFAACAPDLSESVTHAW